VLTPGPRLSDLHTFDEVFAEVGAVLLMFSTGVEFSIPELLRVKWVALVGARIGSASIVLAAIAASLISILLNGFIARSVFCWASANRPALARQAS
jgi:Kef-type K+ transport system membrane component KefB